MFRAHLGAALGDIAVANTVAILEVADAVFRIERMHLQRRGVHQEARSNEFVFLVMVTDDVADILAQEAFNALAELLHAVNVLLVHGPGAISIVRLARLKRLDGLLDTEVPTDVRDQVANEWERTHGFHSDHLVRWQRVHARHAHQAWFAVDFRRARAALAGLAVPAARQVGRLLCLNAVHAVKEHHALGDIHGVLNEGASVLVAAPDAKVHRTSVIDGRLWRGCCC